MRLILSLIGHPAFSPFIVPFLYVKFEGNDDWSIIVPVLDGLLGIEVFFAWQKDFQ